MARRARLSAAAAYPRLRLQPSRAARVARLPHRRQHALPPAATARILAAEYADRPLHLIGPRYYLTWWRLLKLLLIIVPLCAVGGVTLAQTIAGSPIEEIIGQAISVGVAAIVHVAFWVTLVFVIMERTGAETGQTWDLDQLPEPRSTGTGRADLIASLVFAGLTVGALLWDRFRGFVHVDGDALPFLNPDLWPWALLGLLALITLEVGLALLIYARGRWSISLAVANTAPALLFIGWALTLLGNDLLLNPDFVDIALRDNGVQPDSLRVLWILLVFGIVGGSIWDITDGWLKTARDAKRDTHPRA